MALFTRWSDNDYNVIHMTFGYRWTWAELAQHNLVELPALLSMSTSPISLILDMHATQWQQDYDPLPALRRSFAAFDAHNVELVILLLNRERPVYNRMMALALRAVLPPHCEVELATNYDEARILVGLRRGWI